MAYFGLKHTLVPLIRRRLNGISGIENIPKKGPFLIVSNHVSIADAPIIISVFLSVITQKIFFITLPIVAKIFKLLLLDDFFGVIAVDRKQKEKCLIETLGHLQKREISLIFPEAGKSRSENIVKGKTGVARLILWSKVPVLLVGISGPSGETAIDDLKNFFSKKQIKIVIGKPMTFEKYYDQTADKELLEKITSEVMINIGNLIGRKYSPNESTK